MGDILTIQRNEAVEARASAVISLLTEWADWMDNDEGNQGYPKRSAGFGMCVTPGTFEDMCDHADALRMQVVDTCVNDLPPNQKASIYHQYLAAIFRMRDFAGSIIAAHVALERALIAKGMVW